MQPAPSAADTAAPAPAPDSAGADALADSLAGPAADSLARSVADAIVDAVPALGRARDAAQTVNSALADSVAAAVKADAPRAAPTLWDRVVDGATGVTGLSAVVVENLLLTAVAVGVLWGLRQAVLWAVRRRRPEPRVLYTWRKTTTYVVVALGLVVGLRVWLGALGTFGTFLGLLTAGVAIALRDPLVNLAGWVFILWKRPFAPGDRVTVRTHTGDVIDQRLFQFTLLEVGTNTGAAQSTGRIVHVPNGWVFSDSVVNFTGGFPYVWHEVAVTVTFESDWRAAKAALARVAQEHADPLSPDAERRLREAAREYFVFYSKLTPVVYTSVVRDGVQLTLRYLVAPRRIRGSEEAVWEAVLDAFAARDDVAFALPTSRIFRNPEEGKLGAGGRPGGPPEADPSDVP